MDPERLTLLRAPDVHLSIAKAVEVIKEGKTRLYPSDGQKRGRAVIANFLDFLDPKMKRIGSEHDVVAMKETLEMFKFDVDVWDLKNTRAKAFLSKVDRESRRSEHKDSDCFLMSIMSHGGGDGSLESYSGQFELDQVLERFKADNCPQLGGKPKIFVIQACRGTQSQEAAFIRKAVDPTDQPLQFAVPACADFLIAYSQWEGYSSLKSPVHGSLFIQSLCQVLKMDHYRPEVDKEDIQTLLTYVSQVVASFDITELEVQRSVTKSVEERVTEDAEPFDPKTEGSSQNFKVLGVKHVKQSPTMLSSLTRLFYFKSKDES